MANALIDAVSAALDKGRPDDGRETIDNKSRGCGHLKPRSAYVRSDLPALGSPKGEIPAFVRFDDPVEYREYTGKGSIIPGWVAFPGNSFVLHYQAGGRATTPPGDIDAHMQRLRRHGFDGDHYGEITSAHAHDLLMSVGKTNWDTPDAFVDECRSRGLNLKIPVSDRNTPPAIEPLRTRVFVIHPHGCGDERPGIIGFAYLTRTVFTTGPDATPDDPDIPTWADEYATVGKLDVVDRGEPVPADDTDDATPPITDWLEASDGQAADPEPTDDDRDVATVTRDPGHAADPGAVVAVEVEFNRPDVPRDDRVASFDAAYDAGAIDYNQLKQIAANRDEIGVGSAPEKDELIVAIVDETDAFVPAYLDETTAYGGGT